MKYYFLRIKFLLFFLIGIPFLLFLFYGCCENKYRIIGVGEIKLREVDSFDFDTDTITSSFYIDWRLITEIANLEMLNNYSLNATSCSYEFVNDILKESLSISSQSDFMFEGNIIKSGENFVHLGNIQTGSDAEFSQSIFLKVSEEFLTKAQFNKEFYTFDLAAKTSDGLELRGRFRAYFNL